MITASARLPTGCGYGLLHDSKNALHAVVRAKRDEAWLFVPRRSRDRAVASFLERFKNNGADIEVDALTEQLRSLGDPNWHARASTICATPSTSPGGRIRMRVVLLS
jgi:hypothetical protein